MDININRPIKTVKITHGEIKSLGESISITGDFEIIFEPEHTEDNK